MAIPNVNQITSTLRTMSDQQLQQYAMLHKNDPYILPMAVSESNSRKQMRAQGQAQGMGQPQPKVADADIAGMLPEEQGIGALPAPNMARMADGGIAGYADGNQFNYAGTDDGPLLHMAGGGEPVIRMADGGVARFNGTQSQFVQDVSGIPGMYDKWWQANRESDRTKALRESEMAQRQQDELAARQKTSFANYLFGSPEREAEGKAELAQLAAKPVGTPAGSGTMPDKNYTRPGMLYDPRLITTSSAPAADTKPPAADQKPPIDRRALASTPATASAASAAPAASEKSAAERYMDLQKTTGAADRSALANRQTALEAEMNQAALDRAAAKEKEIAERGKYGEAKEARITKREEALGKEKEQMSGLALIEAGLGIMSTPGPLAVAIGKGAKEGLKSYGEGLAKLKMAQERIDDARDQIEEYRRNEANMTAKERRESTEDISKTKLEAKRLGLAAAEKMYGYDREDTKAIFTADTQERLTDKEIASKENIARMQERGATARSGAQIAATLNTPDRLVFNQLVKDNNNDAVKAAEALQKMKAEKFNMYEAYSKYLTGFAGKDQAIVGAPENFTKFASRFGALTPPNSIDTNKADRS